MIKSLANVGVVAALALLIGCAHEAKPASGPRPKTNPNQITFYQKVPGKDYETLGIVSVPVGGAIRMDPQGDATAAFVALQERAAALGANGILLDEKKVASEVVVTASYNGTFYTVPVNLQPKAALGQAIWVYEK